MRSTANTAAAPAKAPSKLEASTLTAQVQDYIISYISDHALKPGDEIPSEMTIVKEFGISRGVVREAFRALGTLGIVEIKSGKKPRVKAFESSVMRTILGVAGSTSQVTLEQILEVRLGLELSCVRMAAKRITKEEIEELTFEMKEIKTKINDPDSFVDHDLRFHHLIARASHNPLYIILLEALHHQIYTSIADGFKIQSTDMERGRIITLHQDVFDAVVKGDEEEAARAMAEHFNVVGKAADLARSKKDKA